MTTYDWQGLMTQWNKTLVDNGYGQRFEPRTLDWFGTQGATEENLLQLEQRLGKTLPPSYRQFLSFSNGWEHPTPFIYKLWSTSDTQWFCIRYQEWIDAWDVNRYPVSDEEYSLYGRRQTEAIRTEYLHTALEISDIGDSAIFLLNPQIVTPDGEWEAWFFANWLPGARRYRSFWELMQGEYASLLQILESFEQTTSKLLAKPC
jgi:hypothetical protein